MSKLRIAITADTYPYASDVTNLVRAPFTARGLVDIINELGALPVVLPDVPGAKGEDYVDLFDALIIPGGPDADPTFYGEEPSRHIGSTNYKRDVFEAELFKAFYKAGKPIFGICRGCQFINILMGGSVYQDLAADNPDSYIRHSQGADGSYPPTHHVEVAKGSSLYKSLGATAYVNSRHHQGIKKVGEGLTVTAKAADGVVEAIETADGQIVAVQWHPENMWQEHAEMRRLFEDFIGRVAAQK